MKTWQLAIAALASAVCTLFSVAPYGSGIAGILSATLLILVALHAKTTKGAMVWVFVFQIPLWLWLHSWVETVAFAGWIGLGLYMSTWASLFVLLLRKIHQNTQISVVVSAPIVWVGLECLRGIVLFDGYPWYLAGAVVLDWPLISIVTIGGVWLASFLVLAIAGLLATIKQVRWWTSTAVGCVILVLCLHRFGYDFIERESSVLNVAVIQTNVLQSNKVAWSWHRQQEDVAKAIELTYQAVAQDPKPEIVIWPETMLPGSGFETGREQFEPWDEEFLPLWYWAEVLRVTANKIDTPILVGAQTWFDITIIKEPNSLRVETGKQFNSAVLVFPDGHTQRYDKTFLTPFGEKIPYLSVVPALQDWVRDTFGAAMLFDLHVGGGPERFALPVIPKSGEGAVTTFATPICFEDTVPSVVRELVWENGRRKSEFLVNLSNDGWFGDDTIAHQQHVREARMRCLENRTPMIRAANTGISCYINIFGKVVRELPSLESGILQIEIRPGLQRPISRIIGDLVAWLSLIGSILLVINAFIRRSKEHDEIAT